MISIMRFRAVLVAAGLLLAAGSTGCALRATTDFGPQSSSSTRSIGVGPEQLPGGISGVSGPEGNSIGLRESEHGATGGSGSAPAAGDGSTEAGGTR